MLKFGFVFFDLCSYVSNLVLMFKSGFVFLSLCLCVFEIVLLCSLNGFGVGFGLVSLKEMRFYGFVFLYFGKCCVCIVSICLTFPSLCLYFVLFLFVFFFFFLVLILFCSECLL